MIMFDLDEMTATSAWETFIISPWATIFTGSILENIQGNLGPVYG